MIQVQYGLTPGHQGPYVTVRHDDLSADGMSALELELINQRREGKNSLRIQGREPANADALERLAVLAYRQGFTVTYADVVADASQEAPPVRERRRERPQPSPEEPSA